MNYYNEILQQITKCSAIQHNERKLATIFWLDLLVSVYFAAGELTCNGTIFSVVNIENLRFWTWPSLAILDLQILKFLVDHRIGNRMCITVPNFTKIGQMVAEISSLNIFKIEAVCHLKFLNVWFFKQLVISGGLIHAIIQNFSKISQTVFSDGAKQYRNIM